MFDLIVFVFDSAGGGTGIFTFFYSSRCLILLFRIANMRYNSCGDKEFSFWRGGGLNLIFFEGKGNSFSF